LVVVSVEVKKENIVVVVVSTPAGENSVSVDDPEVDDIVNIADEAFENVVAIVFIPFNCFF
jgi:hypothetical protein